MRAAFARFPWPGNIRELRSLIGRSLDIGACPDTFGDAPEPPAADDSLATVERRHILGVLRQAGRNRAGAVRGLGVSRKTIDRKCALWGC